MNGVLLRLKMHKRRPKLQRTCILSMETGLGFFLEGQSTKLNLFSCVLAFVCHEDAWEKLKSL